MLNLKQIRIEKGFTQPKLSELSGVPKRTIQEAEARKECRFTTAHKLAVALGVPMDALWKDETE